MFLVGVCYLAFGVRCSLFVVCCLVYFVVVVCCLLWLACTLFYWLRLFDGWCTSWFVVCYSLWFVFWGSSCVLFVVCCLWFAVLGFLLVRWSLCGVRCVLCVVCCMLRVVSSVLWCICCFVVCYSLLGVRRSLCVVCRSLFIVVVCCLLFDECHWFAVRGSLFVGC